MSEGHLMNTSRYYSTLFWIDLGKLPMRVVKPEGKRPLGRPRRRWENNIKMDLRK
jgi:hypothetical protein